MSSYGGLPNINQTFISNLWRSDKITLLAVVIFVAYYARLVFIRKGRSLAPGPTPWPILGNTFQVPTEKSWLYFQELGKKFGPVVRLTLAGREFIVLNKLEDAEELLTKRGQNYSSRQQLVYAGKYRSHDRRLVLLPYGSLLKKQRAAVIQTLNVKNVGAYEHIQERGGMKLLADILKAPNKSYICIKWYAAETLVTIIYGKPFAEGDQADLRILLGILESVIRDFHPRRHLVDTFPILDMLPDVLAPWRIEAKKKHENEFTFYNRLLNDVKKRMDAGETLDCFAARLWEENDKVGLDEMSMTYAAGSAFEAGTDNPAGTILWAIVAMMNYPDTMRKAQKELDKILGAEGYTPPSFEHLQHLPYCVAFVKEVLRWSPVAPIPPHCSVKEDVYKGYYIPAGTIIFPNTWAIHHDEERFPDSYKFIPERFVLVNGETVDFEFLNEGHCGFGYGRRICPGQYLASKMVWLAIVRLLWAFTPTAPLDANGNPILPDPTKCRKGITAEPATFDVTMTPRSEVHVQTIKQAWNH